MQKNKGMTALPLIILIGGIVLEIAITMALVAFYLSESGAGARYSAEALSVSQAGINDAIIKLRRNIGFGTAQTPYYLYFDNRRFAEVSVCVDRMTVSTPCDTDWTPWWVSNKTEITSVGKVFSKVRRIKAVINRDNANDDIIIESIKEVPF